MKLLVFNNLASGVIDGSSFDFIRSIAKPNDEVTIRFANANSDFDDLLKDATDFDAVIACGGDGTVASILYKLRDSGVPVLPFPAGTANLLAQNLSFPNDAPELAKLVRANRTIDCDLGEIEAEGKTRGFTIIAGCGYDATIMQDAAPNKKVLGHLAYFTSAFANPTPQVAKFKIDIDGEHIECEGIGVLLLNFSKITPDLSLQPSSLPCDGMFDVMVLTTATAFGLIPALIGASLDQSGKVQRTSNAIKFYRGKEVHIESDPPLHIQYDGEPVKEKTPLNARILPGVAKIIVGEAAAKEYGK